MGVKKRIFVPTAAILLIAALLFAASVGLSDLRTENERAERMAIMQTLLPGSEHFSEETYDGEDPTIRSIYRAENGFVIETATQGYVGEIEMLVGVDNDGYVTGLTVRNLSETPGLGRRALWDRDFLSQLLNTSGNAALNVQLDGISGATVTSKAIIRSVNAAAAVVSGVDVSSGATTWGG